MKVKEIADYLHKQFRRYSSRYGQNMDFDDVTDIELIEGCLTCEVCGWVPFSRQELLAVIKSAANFKDFCAKCGCFEDGHFGKYVCGGIHVTHDPRTELTLLLEDIAKTIKCIEANVPTQYQMQILIKSFREDRNADVPVNSQALQEHIHAMFQQNHGWGEPLLRTGFALEMKRVLNRLTEIAERLPAG